jgi:KaiC/GvpD/RAD55 family RecA-like ATPase
MAPEIIVVMSGPKFFKTGLIMNFVKHYLFAGMKVYWADTENGVRQVKTRMKQCILQATYEEVRANTFKPELLSIAAKAKHLGGEFINDFYTSDDNCDSIDRRLTELKDEFGFKPDIIVIDDPDKLKANDRKITDTRIRIKTVYTDMLYLNNKWGTFSFVPSQVGRQAITKKVTKVKDLAEDISKSHTAHALLAMCRTELDIEEGLARLVTVLQREGEPYKEGSEIMLKIDASRMYVEELDYDTALTLSQRWVDGKTEEGTKNEKYD